MLHEIKTIKAKKLTRKEMRNATGMAGTCPFPCGCTRNCGDSNITSALTFDHNKNNSGLLDQPR